MDQPRRILFIDAFDSFTRNVVGLLEHTLKAEVVVTRMDNGLLRDNLTSVLSAFDAVVVGPGPGHPSNPDDVGTTNELWKLPAEHVLPVLGICLGFQSLGLAFGAGVTRLARPRHGIVAQVVHDDQDIFSGVGEFYATNYHSLKVDLPNTSEHVELLPLAWDVEDGLNGHVLMGIRHVSRPFWGIQFHPESICTSREPAEKLISNWWLAASEWILNRPNRAVKDRASFIPLPISDFPVSTPATDKPSLDSTPVSGPGNKPALTWMKQSAPGATDPVRLFEALRCSGYEVLLLDSQGHASGRFSILGLVDQNHSTKVMYNVADHTLKYGVGQNQSLYLTKQLHSIDEVWPELQKIIDTWKPTNIHALNHEIPFWGGLIGYLSYEAGLETIDVDLHESCATSKTPDINMVFVHRSIVIDHSASIVYVQTLLSQENDWLEDMIKMIERLSIDSKAADQDQKAETTDSDLLEQALTSARILKPSQEEYSANILACQEELAAGDSYELCLTDETHIITPSNLNPWHLYRKLRRMNAAPYGAFLQLGNDITIVGSSPERFLHWDRTGKVEFRPIKGTVKKSPAVSHNDACAILNSSKERAENLMIVDLIRHDLSGVVGAENCHVSQLMAIEEYETVYQLVSAINGQLPADKRGIDVLRASLPPGSMTGAPKKRSCEILRDLERRPRGVYAGVLGYMDVGGSGDFSVVIRTAVKDEETNTWRVGAGGAITVQSDVDGEFQEMQVKAASVLGAMEPLSTSAVPKMTTATSAETPSDEQRLPSRPRQIFQSGKSYHCPIL